MLPDATWLMGRARVQFPERAFQAELGQLRFGLRPANLLRFPAARCLDVDLSLDARLLDDEQGFARRVGEINLALDVDPSFLRPGDWNVVAAGNDLGKKIYSLNESLVLSVIRVDHANVGLRPVVARSEFNPGPLYGDT